MSVVHIAFIIHDLKHERLRMSIERYGSTLTNSQMNFLFFVHFLKVFTMDIVLLSFGARLRVKDGLFQITVQDITGSNHHIKEQYAPRHISSIALHPSTSASSDALLLAIQHDIPVHLLDRFGNTLGRCNGHKPSSTTEIIEAQVLYAHSHKGLLMARGWIVQKLQARAQHLLDLGIRRDLAKRQILEKAIARIAEMKARMHTLQITDSQQFIQTIEGLEGTAGRLYYHALSHITPDDYTLNGRSYRPALDLYNAYLNYGYAILYNKVEQAILRAGLHAHIGWWHSSRHQRKAFVFDVIEPYRIWVDRVVFKLFSRKLAMVSHASILPEGQYWLQKEGTQLVSQAFLEYFKTQKLELDGKLFSCDTYLTEKTKKLASELLSAFRSSGGRHAQMTH
jgi:CRISP-associated protein Cas1